MNGYWAYGSVLGVAFAVTAGLVPVVRRACIRYGAVKEPNERSVHTKPMPVLGGLAMFGGFAAAFAFASLIVRFKPVFSTSQAIGVAVAVAIAFLGGLIDDVREISAPAKVAVLALAGSVLVLTGVAIVFFRVPFYDLVVLAPDLSAVVTVLWLIGLCNAVNLIDGLDGLAAGIMAIGAGAFLLYAGRLWGNGLIDNSNVGPLVAVIVVGVCLGFLPYNTHPASIMMGDSGALMLGAMMAASTIAVGGNTQAPFASQGWFFYAPLVVPLLILAIPILDTAFSIVRRAVTRSGVATADRKHLHHRLMAMGHGHRRAVLILWSWTLLLSALVLVPVYTGRGNGLKPLVIIGLGLLLFTVLGPWFNRDDANSGGGRETGDGGSPGDSTTLDADHS